MTDNKLLESALAYAEKFNWAVFPLKPKGKEPLTEHGCLDATTDAETIRAWWERWPDANIGLTAGKSGLVILDLDVKGGVSGLETWANLEAELDLHVDTVINLTPSGGQHLLFAAPNGVAISPKVKEWPGIDVRAGNSYIVLPPSTLADDEKYVWELSSRPGELAIMPLPEALRAVLVESKAQAAPPLPDVIPQGQRNATMTSLAGSMRRRGASEAAILAALVEENNRCDPPLDLEELERISKSMARYQPEPSKAADREPGAQESAKGEPEEMDFSEVERLEIVMSADELMGADLPATWIDHYLIFASRMVSAPASFHQTIGLSLLSAIVGRKAGVELRHGRIFPNVWGLLIAPSTVYHKTVAIRLGKGFLERIDPDLIYPDDVTPEAMVSDVMTERAAGIIMRDEFAGWLLGARRDYKSDLKDLYMTLFDCPSTYRRTLRLTGTVTIDDPYLCLISAAVPVRFYNAVRPEDWTNGFLARFLFALPDGDPDWEAKPELATEGDKAEQVRLTEHLKVIYDHYHDMGGKTFLPLGEGVLDRYGKYTIDTTRRAFGHDYKDLLLPFAGRLCDYVMKLAILVQIARGLDEDGNFAPPLAIDVRSLLCAIRYVEGYAADALRLIEERQNVVSGALMQKVFRVIARFGPEGVTHRKALPLTNLKAEIFHQVIEKLTQVGAIEMRRIKEAGSKKAAKHYTATTDRLPIRKW